MIQKKKPTAVFAANDQMAFGTISAAREVGLNVPDDLAVVGFDNIPLSSYFKPSLTTVEIPMYNIGVAAMGMLVDLISLKNIQKARWFETKLLVRESTVKKTGREASS